MRGGASARICCRSGARFLRDSASARAHSTRAESMISERGRAYQLSDLFTIGTQEIHVFTDKMLNLWMLTTVASSLL
jgi:hypothetical protein